MKMIDIMIPVKADEKPDILARVDSEQDVLTLADSEALPPVIGVCDRKGQLIGSVEREINLMPAGSVGIKLNK
ncbi:MAG TPA: hypothetical protein PKA10_11760 [Selenomonadales bacterium]|nr:hypothetical protein [Selenomonadales bacterium]